MSALELKIWFCEFNSMMMGLKENLTWNNIIRKMKLDFITWMTLSFTFWDFEYLFIIILPNSMIKMKNDFEIGWISTLKVGI